MHRLPQIVFTFRTLTMLFLIGLLPVGNIHARSHIAGSNSLDSLTFWFDEVEKLWNSRDYTKCQQAAQKYLSNLGVDSDPSKATLMARRSSRSSLNLGQYKEALEAALEGLKWAEKSGDPNLIAYQYADIAVIYHDFEEYENGINFGKQGLQKAQLLGADTKHQAYILNGIAINFDDWGNSDSALHYHYKVLNLNPLPDSLDIQYTFNNIGNTLLKAKRLVEAEPFLWTSIRLAKRRDNYYNQSSSFTNLGRLYHQLGKNEDAVDFFDSALVYAKLANSIEKLRDTYLDRTNFFKSTQNFQAALENQEKHISLRDSIYQIDRLKVFAELEAQYQGKIKDQQLLEQKQELMIRKANFNRVLWISALFLITTILLTIIHFLNRNRFKKKQLLLQKEKELEIKEAAIRAALTSQEEEKKRFAKDLHDGFGQLITSLKLRLHQLEKEQNLSEKIRLYEQSEQLLDEMHQEIRHIAFNMMPETLVKNGLTPALKELALKLNKLQTLQIQVDTFDMEDRLLDIQEISIYRIIQEWVNNTLKHGTATRIDIQLIRDIEEIRLMIEDDGDGFNSENLNSTKGYGWKNIQSRVNILKGYIDLDTEPSKKGIVLMITIPLNSSLEQPINQDKTRAYSQSSL